MKGSSLSWFAWAGSFVTLLVASTQVAYGIDPSSAAAKPNEAQPEQMAVPGGGFVEPKPGQPGQHARGGWYLGVYGSYTDTGLLLTDVYPNTAAARAGLEVDDRIVAVNGHQIGLLYNSRLNLDIALQRHTGRNGWVRLLVQDRRSKRLVNVDVLLTRGRVHT